jgi:sugar phosphate isomerase/epimerase
MLITCAVSSLNDLVKPKGRAKPKLALDDVPQYIRQELGLHGMNLSTELLVGANRQRLEKLRDRADKAGCACLLLHEPEPQPLADENKADDAIDRMRRVLAAAHALGCNSASMAIQAKNTDADREQVIDAMRSIMESAEKLELNLLIQPIKGLTEQPDDLTELIKKIGGFRVGTLPDFDAAAASDDPALYLRRLAPYASVIVASLHEFEDADPSEGLDDDAPGSLEDLADMLMDAEAPTHTTFDIVPMLAAIKAVGFEGTLAIDYRGGEDGTLGVLKGRDAIEAGLESLVAE